MNLQEIKGISWHAIGVPGNGVQYFPAINNSLTDTDILKQSTLFIIGEWTELYWNKAVF